MNPALKYARFLVSYEVSERSQLTSPKSTKWMLTKYLLDATVFFRKSICHKNVPFKMMTSWNGAARRTPQTVLFSPRARASPALYGRYRCYVRGL